MTARPRPQPFPRPTRAADPATRRPDGWPAGGADRRAVTRLPLPRWIAVLAVGSIVATYDPPMVCFWAWTLVFLERALFAPPTQSRGQAGGGGHV